MLSQVIIKDRIERRPPQQSKFNHHKLQSKRDNDKDYSRAEIVQLPAVCMT